MLEDFNEYLTARYLKLRPILQPWEVGELPEYWLNRQRLFDSVFADLEKGAGEDPSADEE
jgi:hypothetical protein